MLLRSEEVLIISPKFGSFQAYHVSLQFSSFLHLHLEYLSCLWEAPQNYLLLCSWYCDTLDIFFETLNRPTWDHFVLPSCGRYPRIILYLFCKIFLWLWIQIFLIYAPNYSAGIMDCRFWWNLVKIIPFLYTMKHLL